MTVVIDASAVMAGLVDRDPSGDWARELWEAGELAAPHLLPVEVANALRRLVSSGDAEASTAAGALGDLAAVPVELYPFEGLAERVWELRGSLTAYDAWYVALAEALEAPLATLDRRLMRAPGPRCTFWTPP